MRIACKSVLLKILCSHTTSEEVTRRINLSKADLSSCIYNILIVTAFEVLSHGFYLFIPGHKVN